MEITKNDIRRIVDSKSYSRGVGYYINENVYSCNANMKSTDHLALDGNVFGSRDNIYEQRIDIFLKNNIVRMVSHCDCPVNSDCKHVVALCLEYINHHQEKINLLYQTDSWLELLEKTEDKLPIINYKESHDYFLTYRLFPSNTHKKDDLLFFKSKYLKNGELNQGSQLESQKIINENYLNYLKNYIDDDIMKLVYGEYQEQNIYYYSSSKVEIVGSFWYNIIIKILETKRCYFDTNKTALFFNNELFSPEIKFKKAKEEYSISFNTPPKKYKLLETTPALIINIENNSVQKFDIDINLYNKISKAPKIAVKDIGKVYSSISNLLPNIKINTPSDIKIIKLDSKPIPQINLKYTTDEHEDKKFTAFKLDFNYDDYIVSYNPRTKAISKFNDNSKIEIKRDLKLEESAKNIIQELGFEIEETDNNLSVVLKDDNKQRQLQLWKKFLNEDIIKLENDGWIITKSPEFDMKFEPNTQIIVDSEDENGWFSLSFNFEFNGISQPIAPLVSTIIEEFDNFDSMPESINLEISENHFIEVETKQIQPIIQTIIELFDKKDKDDNLKVSSFDTHLIANMDENVIWKGNREILELSKKLKNFEGIKRVEPPKALNASLRDYQQEGLNWLNFLHEFKFSGILADDMGLGKTIQTLAHLSRLKEENGLSKPTLIVMPTSLIANWKNEIKKFTPNLSVLSLHGADRGERFKDMHNYDILLTTYALVVRDEDKFKDEKFFYIILDEAQKIKNPKTKMTMALKTFKSDYRLALSGTPIENHLGELWSIFSFLMPGFLDTLSFFRNYYQLPIEKERNMTRQELLNKRVKPFMIRRTKEKVADELPSKSEIIKYTQFSTKQSKLYESIRVTMEEKVKEAIAKKGIGSSHITILDALLKLRQVCCDPSLLKIKEAQKVKESAKLDLFLDLIDELLLEDRKILVFSQFTTMLKIIEEAIKKRKIEYTKLTGSTIKREEAIEKFTKGDAKIFLISLKAGGVGLNLVEADTVIHYDPWWNPAVENQATDRAYRIGQTKAVFVYKLIVENTIEEKILEMQKKKQAIQEGIYDKDKQQDDIKFKGNELLELLK